MDKFYLMRKDEIITMILIDDDYKIRAFSQNMTEHSMEIAPLRYKSDKENYIKKWWEERSIPVTRDKYKELFKKKNLTSYQYLVNNLGLSLTDYYWIKPVDSDLCWSAVNLFDNEFKDNILVSNEDEENFKYSPNSSLQGDIEKTWSIINNDRYIIKGNRSGLSKESLNEVIASHIHKLQGYIDYADYKLIKINDKPYKYGCMSKAFTSQKKELVSAWDICSSEKKSNETSYYEHFISICKKYGADECKLRNDLEYQIMTDYIMTGYDRHLNNISVLRDADTLKFMGMAPIYDSGDSFFANKEIPTTPNDLKRFKVNSFASSEEKLLKYVKDYNVVDLTKLPPVSYIRSINEKDDNIAPSYIDKICQWYEYKIDACRELQLMGTV